MTIKKEASRLLDHFTGPFLEGLASGDRSVQESLNACHCPVDAERPFPYRFRLAQLFEAIWHHAKKYEVDPGFYTPWSSCFKEFCRQLMSSWPIDAFTAHGLTIQLAHKSNSYARTEYEIDRI